MPESIITVAREPTADTIAGRTSIDGRRAVEMPAAVIGHDDAVGADRDRALGVLRMQDALDHERALPAVAQPRELLPGVAAAGAQDCIVSRGLDLVGLRRHRARGWR